MARKKTPTLTEAELRLMRILWEHNDSTVSDVMEKLPKENSLAYNTVTTLNHGFPNYEYRGGTGNRRLAGLSG